MRRTILAAILLAATIARADGVAIHFNDGICGVYNSLGTAIVLGATRITYTAGFDGIGTAHWTCQADQGFPAGRMIRLDAENTGQPCGVGMAGGVIFSDNWRETISTAGHITVTCTVVP